MRIEGHLLLASPCEGALPPGALPGLEPALALAWQWPGAAEAVAAARGALALAAEGEPLEALWRLSAALVEAAAEREPLGVLIGGALTPAGRFMAVLEEAEPEAPPLELWVALALDREAGTARTVGLAALGLAELTGRGADLEEARELALLGAELMLRRGASLTVGEALDEAGALQVERGTDGLLLGAPR